jgi:hypothetical protein
MSEKIKCTFCNKEIDVTVGVIPPTWYGKYDPSANVTQHLVAICCSDCIKIEDNKKKWIY